MTGVRIGRQIGMWYLGANMEWWPAVEADAIIVDAHVPGSMSRLATRPVRGVVFYQSRRCRTCGPVLNRPCQELVLRVGISARLTYLSGGPLKDRSSHLTRALHQFVVGGSLTAGLTVAETSQAVLNAAQRGSRKSLLDRCLCYHYDLMPPNPRTQTRACRSSAAESRKGGRLMAWLWAAQREAQPRCPSWLGARMPGSRRAVVVLEQAPTIGIRYPNAFPAPREKNYSARGLRSSSSPGVPIAICTFSRILGRYAQLNFSYRRRGRRAVP